MVSHDFTERCHGLKVSFKQLIEVISNVDITEIRPKELIKLFFVIVFYRQSTANGTNGV